MANDTIDFQEEAAPSGGIDFQEEPITPVVRPPARSSLRQSVSPNFAAVAGPMTGVPLDFSVISKPLLEIAPTPAQIVAGARGSAPIGLDYRKVTRPMTEEQVAKRMKESPAAAAVVGGAQALGDIDSFFTSPLGIATLATAGLGAIPAAAQRAVALGFSAQMASQTPEIARQIGDELGKPENERDYAKISRLTVNALANTGFTAAGAVHGLAPRAPEVTRPLPPVEPQAVAGGTPVVQAGRRMVIAPPGMATLEQAQAFTESGRPIRRPIEEVRVPPEAPEGQPTYPPSGLGRPTTEPRPEVPTQPPVEPPVVPSEPSTLTAHLAITQPLENEYSNAIKQRDLSAAQTILDTLETKFGIQAKSEVKEIEHFGAKKWTVFLDGQELTSDYPELPTYDKTTADSIAKQAEADYSLVPGVKDKETGKPLTLKQIFAPELSSAAEPTPTPQVSPTFSPEIAKTGPAEAGGNDMLGNPLGTQYYATPEDWTAWQQIQADKAAARAAGHPEAMAFAFAKNEVLKNKYGGSVPLPPKGAPAEPMVTLYHGEGGAGGAGVDTRFFTRDPVQAARYGPNVTQVEVPKSVADAAEAARQAQGIGTPGAILPQEWVKQAKPMAKPPEAPVTEIPEAAPAKLTAAAYMPEGATTPETGPNHPAILKRLGVPGFESAESRNTPQFGFVDENGEFLSRENAAERAKSTGQDLKDFVLGEPAHSDEIESPTKPGTPISETAEAGVSPPPLSQTLQSGSDVVRRTEGAANAKEAKSQLIDEVQKAIDAAPRESVQFPGLFEARRKGSNLSELVTEAKKTAGTVTIDVPGDGRFTVLNTKEALQLVLDRAKRIVTDPNAPVKVTKRGTSKEDKQWITQQVALQGGKLEPTPTPAKGLIAGTDVEKWADNVIKTASQRLRSGLDPELAAAGVVKGAAILERGITEFAKWSTEMVRAFGEAIRPHLASLFEQARDARAQVFRQSSAEPATRAVTPPATEGSQPPPSSPVPPVQPGTAAAPAEPVHGIAARVTEAAAKAGIIAPIEPGEGIAAAESVAHGRDLLAKGANPQTVLDEFNRTKAVTADGMAVVRAQGERLRKAAYAAADRFGTKSAQYEAAWKADSDWTAAIKPMQTEWHKIGQAQQGEVEVDTGTFHGLRSAFFEATGKDFTPDQKTAAERIAKGVKQAQNEADQAKDTAFKKIAAEVRKEPAPAPTRARKGKAPVAKPLPQRVWERARQIIDGGETDFDDVRHKLATEFGIPVAEVTRIMAEPKTIRVVTDEMYRKMSERRRAVQQAKNWLKDQQVPGWLRFIRNVPRVFFIDKVFGHGTVGMITHAGLNIFNPAAWSTYWPNFLRQYKLLVSPAYHERMMQDLVRDPLFTRARRAGLANDPFRYQDDYQTPGMAKWLGRLGLAGNRGFDSLKLFRQARFNQIWNDLPPNLKTPQYAQLLADSVNHSTGVVKSRLPGGEWANWTFFAPKLEGSRWAWMAVDPIKAAGTFLDWGGATPEARSAALAQLKEKATIAGMYYGLLALNQGILSASGSKDKVNFTNPRRSDFMAFKAEGHNIGIISPMLGMVRLFANMVHASTGKRGKVESLQSRADEMGATVAQYARGKLSPFAGFGVDLAAQSDFQGRPLPYSSDVVPKYLREQGIKKYTYGEYAAQEFTPIPVSEAIREVWRAQGMKEDEMTRYLDALLVGVVAGGTGARITVESPKRK